MFCPSCGSDQSGQYCRSCGADLRVVRVALDNPGAVNAPLVSAREEIARAVADKIREVKTAKELSKVVEEVLPELESFLEAPEEKRLRRLRRGTITSAIGLAAGLSFTIFGSLIQEEGFIFFGCVGFVFLLIGLGAILNGLYFTVPKNWKEDAMSDVLRNTLQSPASKANPPELPFTNSVTDHTTYQLPKLPERGSEAARK